MIRARPARPEDAAALAPLLRAADRREIEAADGLDPALVLAEGIAGSDPCHAVVDGDRILALFGVTPSADDPEVGMVWLLGSDELVARGTLVARRSRAYLALWHQRYRVLWNMVDARNEVHLRWLRWCGFTVVGRVEHHGAEQRPFYEVRHERAESGDPGHSSVLAS